MYGEQLLIDKLEAENRELRAEVAALKEVNEQLLTDATKLFVKRMMAEDLGEGKWHGEIQFSANPGIDAIGLFAYETLKEHNAPNFVTWTLHTPDFPVAITFQKVGGKTPEQRLAELEKENKELEQVINRLNVVKMFNAIDPQIYMRNGRGREAKQADMTANPPKPGPLYIRGSENIAADPEKFICENGHFSESYYPYPGGELTIPRYCFQCGAPLMSLWSLKGLTRLFIVKLGLWRFFKPNRQCLGRGRKPAVPPAIPKVPPKR